MNFGKKLGYLCLAKIQGIEKSIFGSHPGELDLIDLQEGKLSKCGTNRPICVNEKHIHWVAGLVSAQVQSKSFISLVQPRTMG